jgi:hypothetical protein
MQKIELTIEDDAIASVFIEMLKNTSFVSIDNISHTADLPQATQELLENRLNAYQQNPQEALSWAETLQAINQKRYAKP